MIFQYKDMNGREAFCEIDRKGNLIIATELAENTGASVTNSCNYIATQYCNANNIPFEDLIFIEHYGNKSYTAGDKRKKRKDTFDLVTFRQEERFGEKHFATPEWKHLNEDEYQELLNSQSNVLWE